jgi:hypothetical protein
MRRVLGFLLFPQKLIIVPGEQDLHPYSGRTFVQPLIEVFQGALQLAKDREQPSPQAATGLSEPCSWEVSRPQDAFKQLGRLHPPVSSCPRATLVRFVAFASQASGGPPPGILCKQRRRPARRSGNPGEARGGRAPAGLTGTNLPNLPTGITPPGFLPEVPHDRYNKRWPSEPVFAKVFANR